jgi:PAS domain S-box-containing protein
MGNQGARPPPDLRGDVQRIIIGDILRLALPLLAGASAVGVVIGALSGNALRLGTPVIGLVLCGVAWALLRRDKPHRSVQVLLVAYGASSLFAMLFNGGLRAPAAAILLALVAMVGWVYGRRAASRATFAAVGVVFLVALLSSFGVLRLSEPPSPLLHACYFALYLLLIWIATAFPQERLRSALEDSVEREQAVRFEQQRREASDLAFRAVFEHTAHLMILVSPRGLVVDVNRAALTFLRADTREAAIGLPLVDSAVWPELDRERFRGAMDKALASQPESLRCEFRTPDGAVHTWDFTLAPSLDPQQALHYVIVEGRDVTVQLEVERHQRRARRLEMVGQLAGGVAHDFNNVLAAILSSSEMVKAELEGLGALNADVREGLDTISSAGMRAADLTRRLLTFARRAPLEKRVVSMHEVLGSTVKLLARSLPPTIKLQTRLEAGHDSVEADPASIESMLLNLAINARDAMPEGGTLTLSTTQVGSLLRLAVRDSGSGIAPELLDHIFEPFFTTKPEGKGTGIGLASVFGAIRAHGGSVQVSSEVGRGTVFELDFPLVETRPTSTPPQAESLDLSGLNALVVDDEPALCRVMNRMLRALGIGCVLSSDAESGLVEFQKSPDAFDFAVLDIVLPGRSGSALAADLLALSPKLKVLFVSGYPRDTDLAAFPKDRVHLLGKPFTPEALRAALIQLMPPRAPGRVMATRSEGAGLH